MSILRYIQLNTKLKLMAGATPKWMKNSKRCTYIRAVCLSAPMWVRREDFAALWAEREWQSAIHNKQYTFDHIVPVNNPRVCGLTVPWNIQVIPWDTNGSKGNTWCPEQEELFC